MNIALTGGGTAGHIMPNLALLPYLRQSLDNIIYIGNKNCQEKSLCDKYNVDFFHCDSIKLDRHKIYKNLAIPFVLPKYIKSAKAILKDNNIDVVFSKGGFVSLPVVLGAKELKIPVVCHESDFTLGVTNKITSCFAKRTILSYPSCKTIKNSIAIGNPLRDEIFESKPQNVLHQLGINSNKKVLLIVGGSSGAKVINECVYKSIPKLTQDYVVIHICGKSLYPIKHNDYYQLQFVHNIADYLMLADLIVARCGASLSGEITALNKKVLYIPLSSKASRGDQVDNANYLCSSGYAMQLSQDDLSPTTLVKNLNELQYNFIKKPYFYDRQIPSRIVKEIIKTVKH